VLYDGRNRGGIKNVRYAQFRPDVVRVVIDLDALRDYTVERGTDQVRVEMGADRGGFAAWSSQALALAVSPPSPEGRGGQGVRTSDGRGGQGVRTSDGRGGQSLRTGGQADDAALAALALPARVAPPTPGRPTTIAEYLAAHASEAAQSQAPRITVQWDNATIEEVIAGFAAFSGRTIVLGKGVQGNLTAEIKNQPWDLAFYAVMESQALGYQVLPGGIIHVLSKVDLARADSTVPLETRLVRINYARASSLLPSVQSIVSKPRGQVAADSTTNSLVITEVATRISQVEDFVRGMDIRTPQVSIQAKIIFVDRLDVEELGIKYDLGSPTQFFNRMVQRRDPSTAEPVDTDLDGVPDALVPTEFFSPDDIIVDLAGNALSALGNAGQEVINPALELIFSTAIGNFDLTTFVQALQRVELADIQAEPVITTLDNRPAEILVGDRVPIRVIDVSSATAGQTGPPRATVSFQQTGINLKVTPHVTANRQVLMEVHAERSSIRTAAVDIGFTFQTQQADNQILVSDGETAVIGGLTVTEVTVSKSGIPFLVDLPILGGLFGFKVQNENRRDLLILITPHIIDDTVTPSTGR
jgi:type IV pilus assembly protein PilQ